VIGTMVASPALLVMSILIKAVRTGS
jgi:hypothetical protein